MRFNLIKQLTLNVQHHEKIKSLDYTVNTFNIETMFHNAYKILFKFNKQMNNLFEEMMQQAKPNKSTQLICAQIRIGEDEDLNFTSRKNSRFYWQFIQANFIPKLTAFDYKIFITTDTPDVIDEAIGIFGPDTIVAFKERSFHNS